MFNLLMVLLAPPKIHYHLEEKTLKISGNWTIQSISQIKKPEIHETKINLIIDCEKLQKIDSAGVYALITLQNELAEQEISTEILGLSPEKASFYHLIQGKLPKHPLAIETDEESQKSFLGKIGYQAYLKYLQLIGLLTLIGDLLTTLFKNAHKGKRYHLDYIVSNISQTGLHALPILGLLSFLIGIVLAYQMGLQLETYGANIFIAYLSGMAIFREFGPLITAIIVAGRTSSAFTAQIGSMKLNEEIDALETMGLSPTEFLVAPKVIGLTIVFPLLIFWSNIFGVLGAMFMSKAMLNIGYHDFLMRLKESVGLKQMMLGLYKAPAFSILIALVGCFQGFRVGNSADSVGHQTTKSVVQALFLIIIADAIYSIIYSALDL
jgi:phospholipid/cholesterol/gamma-HCH transport system permease protein